MRARRTFDEKFKRQVVESVLSGSISQVKAYTQIRNLTTADFKMEKGIQAGQVL